MSDLNPLRQFLASWFVDADGSGGDEAAARHFARSSSAENTQAVLEQAAALMSGDPKALVATLDREANRYFETPEEARAWLKAICEAVRQECSA